MLKILQYLPTMIVLCATALALALLLILKRRANRDRSSKGAEIQRSKHFWRSRALGGSLIILLVCGTCLWLIGFRLGVRSRVATEWIGDPSPDLEPLVRSRCASFVADGHAVGLAVALIRDEDMCLMGFGQDSILAGKQVDGHTSFEIGSITKTFTGLLLACAVERGDIGLDKPLCELLPDASILPEGARGITLRQLTTHTSGFPRMPDSTTMLPGNLGMLFLGMDPYSQLTETSYLENLRGLELEAKPGERSIYSNFGATMLGWALARHAGISYEDLIKREILQPLAMGHTTISRSAHRSVRQAQGYRDLGVVGPLSWGLFSQPWLEDPNFSGAGGIRATTSDMVKYLLANMRPDEGSLGSAIRRSHQQLFEERLGHGIAMNWIRWKSERLDSNLIWHNGATGGFSSFIGFTEDRRHGVVILSNSTASVDSIGMELLQQSALQSNDAD